MDFMQLIYEFMEETLREDGEINSIQMDVLNRLMNFAEKRMEE